MTSARILDQAAEEIEEAAAFLENARPGFGARFVAEYEDLLIQAIEFPASGRLIQDPPPPPELRAFYVHHFGYTLVVAPELGGTLTVVALAHQSREPGYWKDRLK